MADNAKRPLVSDADDDDPEGRRRQKVENERHGTNTSINSLNHPLPQYKKGYDGGRGGSGGGGSSGDYKRPRYQSSSWSSSLQAVRNGQAILFTCDVGREAKAAKEMSVVLERYAEEAKGSGAPGSRESTDDEYEVPAATAAVTDSTEKNATASETVRTSLQQEIAELKKEMRKGAKATMATVETGCKGTCGISIPRNGPLSPVGTCLRMLEEAKVGHSSTRGIVKLMPLERISFGGDLEAIKVQVRDLLHDKGLLFKEQEQEQVSDVKAAAAAAAPPGAEDGKGTDEAKKPTYMVRLCRRNYAAHTRDEIFEALGDVIGDRWKVDLQNPDHVILMEAIKGTIGFSICPRFIELKRYNLRQLQDQAREVAKTVRKGHVEKEEE